MKKDYQKYLTEQKLLSMKKDTTFKKRCEILSTKTGNDELFISTKKRMKKFKHLFEYIKIKRKVAKGSKALSLGSRRGEEIMALRNLGYNAIGVDLVPHGDYVIKGDFHHLKFEDNEFSLVFSNSLDHAFDLQKVFDEIWRVLRKNAYCVLHLVVGNEYKGSKEIVTNIESLKDIHKFLLGKFYIYKSFDFIGGFGGGLNTLVILRSLK